MGRIEKQKRLLIEESNRSLLNEVDGYYEYGTNIIDIANQFSGGGYKWEGVSGVCIPLKHDGKIIRSYDEGGPSHCCGFTLSIAFIAATNRGLLENKTENESHIYDGDSIIGINYRSSQKSTDGIGSSSEHFSDSGKGKVDKDVTYFGRMNS